MWLNTPHFCQSTRKVRFNVVLTEPLYNEIHKIAEKRGSTDVEVVRQFIRLGLLLAKSEESPDMKVLLCEGDSTRELVLI